MTEAELPLTPELSLGKALSALGDPSRRAVFEYVLRAGSPTSRDSVAEALGMVRSTAAFHLDRLAAEDLLEVSFRRLTGRTGPGSGRPHKLYSPAVPEVALSLPPRRYDLAGELLAAGVDASIESGDPVAESLRAVATRAGKEIGQAAGSLETALEQFGYKPAREEDDSIVLLNCPFHRLSRAHTTTICGLNLDLLGAVAESANPGCFRAVLEPHAERCCVRLQPQPDGSE